MTRNNQVSRRDLHRALRDAHRAMSDIVEHCAPALPLTFVVLSQNALLSGSEGLMLPFSDGSTGRLRIAVEEPGFERIELLQVNPVEGFHVSGAVFRVGGRIEELVADGEILSVRVSKDVLRSARAPCSLVLIKRSDTARTESKAPLSFSLRSALPALHAAAGEPESLHEAAVAFNPGGLHEGTLRGSSVDEWYVTDLPAAVAIDSGIYLARAGQQGNPMQVAILGRRLYLQSPNRGLDVGAILTLDPVRSRLTGKDPAHE